jgi:hypothetical protein
MKLHTVPREPNHVELIWAVRRITAVQAKYISMFYGEDVLRALKPHLADGQESDAATAA